MKVETTVLLGFDKGYFELDALMDVEIDYQKLNVGGVSYNTFREHKLYTED